MWSFANPETHFHVVVSETSVGQDGLRRGEPTGEIQCTECGAMHLNIDEIPHAEDCSQRFVRSEWWQDAAWGDE